MSILKALNQLVGLVRVDPDVSIDDAITLTEKRVIIPVGASTSGNPSAVTGGISLGCRAKIKAAWFSHVGTENSTGAKTLTLYAEDTTETLAQSVGTLSAAAVWEKYAPTELTLTTTTADRIIPATASLCALVSGTAAIATPAGNITVSFEELDAA